MKQYRSARSPGFTLTEVLVAMVIAIIGILMMFQIASSSEARKRNTSAGSDAQVTGSSALFTLERDLRQAGNGFAQAGQVVGAMGCAGFGYQTAPVAGAFPFTLAPVLITSGVGGGGVIAGPGAPDTLTVFFGNGETSGLSQPFSASSATSKTMSSAGSRAGFMPGDLVVVSSVGACGMVEITANTAADGKTVSHVNGAVYTRYYPPEQLVGGTDADYEYATVVPVAFPTSQFNAPAGYNIGSGQLYNLGKRSKARLNTWAISPTQTLSVFDQLHSTVALDVGEGIINLQAEYGLDMSGTRDQLVDCWHATSPPGVGSCGAATTWDRVIAVRVALLARSQYYDRTVVTAVAPVWNRPATPTNAAAVLPFVMTNVDGTADSYSAAPTNPNPNNWRHYRYRVYQSTIPMRNIIWGEGT